MAGRGPAPKDPDKRRARNIDPIPTTYVREDGELRGPALPDHTTWPEATRTWWRHWRMSPQAQTMTTTDWDFLLDTAVLHAAFWTGNKIVGAELRLRVAKFGATPEDRARLRLHITEPDAKSDPESGEPQPQQAGRYGHLRTIKTA